ncbi:hypothetical protein KEH51_05260 [[Brevibacterium] frigoritolerans]|uniref:Uncharacterized protein n=1 Tax=Peribacillus frigoritolerans TaxID=450367 RepID=A0A941FIY2_9BACI|nr:hypothetical protein [Peribacillus frigoritolerans]
MDKKMPDKDVEKYHAIAVGCRTTKMIYPHLYNPFSTHIDIQFITPDGKILTTKRGMLSGFQLKAITTNYDSQILQNIMEGRGFIKKIQEENPILQSLHSMIKYLLC